MIIIGPTTAATFMVLGGRPYCASPPPQIWTRCLLYFLYTVNTVIGQLCLATKSVDLSRNLCASLLYFVVRVRCRRKESSRPRSRILSLLCEKQFECLPVYGILF